MTRRHDRVGDWAELYCLISAPHHPLPPLTTPHLPSSPLTSSPLTIPPLPSPHLTSHHLPSPSLSPHLPSSHHPSPPLTPSPSCPAPRPMLCGCRVPRPDRGRADGGRGQGGGREHGGDPGRQGAQEVRPGVDHHHPAHVRPPTRTVGEVGGGSGGGVGVGWGDWGIRSNTASVLHGVGTAYTSAGGHWAAGGDTGGLGGRKGGIAHTHSHIHTFTYSHTSTQSHTYIPHSNYSHSHTQTHTARAVGRRQAIIKHQLRDSYNRITSYLADPRRPQSRPSTATVPYSAEESACAGGFIPPTIPPHNKKALTTNFVSIVAPGTSST